MWRIYIGMGWLSVTALPFIYRAAGLTPIVWLVVGYYTPSVGECMRSNGQGGITPNLGVTKFFMCLSSLARSRTTVLSTIVWVHKRRLWGDWDGVECDFTERNGAPKAPRRRESTSSGKNPIYGGESLRDLKCRDLRRGYAWKLFLIGYPSMDIVCEF